MHSNPVISGPANQTLVASQAAPGHRVSYIEAAPTMNVMFDQLEYLLGHESQGCPAGCQDCIRLRGNRGLATPTVPPDRDSQTEDESSCVTFRWPARTQFRRFERAPES